MWSHKTAAFRKTPCQGQPCPSTPSVAGNVQTIRSSALAVGDETRGALPGPVRSSRTRNHRLMPDAVRVISATRSLVSLLSSHSFPVRRKLPLRRLLESHRNAGGESQETGYRNIPAPGHRSRWLLPCLPPVVTMTHRPHGPHERLPQTPSPAAVPT